MKFIFTIAAFVFVVTCSAQKDTAWVVPVDSNTVIVHKDSRLDLLVKTQATINEVTSRDGRKTDKGFRLMIISTNNRYCYEAETLKPLPGNDSRINQQLFLPAVFSFNILLNCFFGTMARLWEYGRYNNYY